MHKSIFLKDPTEFSDPTMLKLWVGLYVNWLNPVNIANKYLGFGTIVL